MHQPSYVMGQHGGHQPPGSWQQVHMQMPLVSQRGGATKYEPLADGDNTSSEVRSGVLLCCGTCCGGFILILIGYAAILFGFLNNFQAWSIQNPNNPVSRLYQPYLDMVEGFWAMNPLYLDRQRLLYGNNFMVAGQVVLGDFDSVETALTSPQGRTTNLGASPMIVKHLPKVKDGSSLTFLLALSDQGAGGNGNHGKFKAALDTVIFNHAAGARQADDTAARLLRELGAEYEQLSREGAAGMQKFFESPENGWMRFMVRYMHYVLLGMNPDDEEATALLTQAYYSVGGAVHYLEPLGWLKSSQVEGIMERVTQLYVSSPAMQEHPGALPEYNYLTNTETSKLLTAMMCIAAMQGPYQLGLRLMAYKKLPDLESAKKAGLAPPSSIDMGEQWDALDLDNDEAIELHILETSRLYMAVSAVHRVSQEPFTANVAGADREFPAGTVVNVPMSLAMLDPQKWGETRYQFNPQRAGLRENTMAFNEVGNRHAGRACPGKGVSLTMLSDVLQEVGAARRRVLGISP